MRIILPRPPGRIRAAIDAPNAASCVPAGLGMDPEALAGGVNVAGGIVLSNRVCGAGMALVGFSLSLIIGLWVDNPFVTVVLRSLLVMVMFYLLGCLLFSLGRRAVQENFDDEVKRIEKSEPIPPEPAPADLPAESTEQAPAAAGP